MDKKAITLQQLEEALRDLARWIRDKLRGYVAEPEAEGKSGYVLTTNGAGGRSWEPGGAEEPDKTLSIEGAAADAKAVGEKKADKPKTNGIMKAVNGSLVAAEAGVDYQAPIEAGEITAEKIADASVQRSKLATDALYSPFKMLGSGNANYSLSLDDLGCTIKTNDVAGNYSITLSDAVGAAFPVGGEVAFFWQQGKSFEIVCDTNTRFALAGQGSYIKATVALAERFTMVALKKMSTEGGVTYWILTGNVEVVS